MRRAAEETQAGSGPAPAGAGPRRALIALCVTEITSWGVLYYAFPVMVAQVSRDTGWSTAAAMGAFSVGAVTAALAGIVVGRLIDARGPRAVMTVGSVLGVLGALAVAAAPTLPLFYAAWVLAGLAQSALLYPPAFVALTGWYGTRRVRAQTTVPLVGGLASTVFAPLVATLLDHMSWRAVFVVLACVVGVVTLPLHAFCLTAPWPGRTARPDTGDAAWDDHARRVVRGRGFLLLTGAMAVGALGMYAATVNLVPLLTGRGLSTHLAAIGLGLCGAGQVLGRLGYVTVSTRTTPRFRTVAVLIAGAVTVAVLGVLPGPAAALIAVAVVAGAARGVYTLLQATAVSDRWGTRAFGRINGVFTAPITAMTALAPGAGALAADLAGGFPAAYVALAGVTVLGAVAALAARPAT